MRLPSTPIIFRRGSERGQIASAIVATVIMMAGLTAAMILFNNTHKARALMVQTSTADVGAGQKLEQLLSLSSSDASLTAGAHTDSTANSPYTWTVTDVTTRLKKIVLVTQVRNSANRSLASQATTGMTGYKYGEY